MLLRDYLLRVGRGVESYFPEMRTLLRPRRAVSYKNESNESNGIATTKVTKSNQGNESNQSNKKG